MPQVIKTQPTGAYTEGSQNIGAVIFDKPQYDTMQVAMKVNDDLENLALRRAAQAEKQKAESAKLVADLNFDSKGAFPDDTDYFKQGAEKLKQQVTDLYGYPTNSAEYNKKLQEAELAKSWMQSDVNESAKQWEQYKDSWAKFNPEKHDQKKFNEWNAKVRLARTPEQRRELFKESPLVDRVGNFQQMLGERMAKGLYKPTKVEKSAYDPIKGTVIESTEEYTPQNIIDNARAIISGDEDMLESAQKGLNELKAKSSLLYDQINNEAKQLGIDPVELYTRKQLQNSVNKKFELKNPAWSPAQEAAAKYEYDQKKEEGMVNFVIEQGGNLLNGNPESFTIGGVTPKGFEEGQFNWDTPIYSDQFQGWKAGNFTVRTPLTDDNGNVVGEDLQSKPNYVLGWKYEKGVPYIKTDESQTYAGQKVGGKQVDQSGWVQADRTDIERIIAANSSDPSKAIERYRTKLIKEKAYPRKQAQPQQTVPQVKVTEQAIVKKPTEKTVEKTSTIKIGNKSYGVAKQTKGYQLSRDGKKAKITYIDGTTEIINL